MSTYDELAKLNQDSPAVPGHLGNSKRSKNKNAQSINQSINQSIDRPIDQSMDWPAKVEELGPVVGKPRGLYLTQKVDLWLDDAVRYLRSKDLHKVDRSVVVNTLLHSPDLFEPTHLDGLRKRLLAHLTNKSLRRAQSTD